jgi:hypothetical protein
MMAVAHAIPWAIAMILLAFGERYGLVESRTATTMLAILPVLAVATTTRRRRQCALTVRDGKGMAL